jgi:hypothetical protein
MELVLLAPVRLHGIGRGGNSPQKTRAVHRARSAGGGRTSGRLSRRLYVDSPDLSSFGNGVEESDGRCGASFRKKSTARFPPCWRRRRRSPTPSSTLREVRARSSAKPHPLRGYFYIGSAAFLWGISATLGRAAFTGHRFARRDLAGRFTEENRSADPVAEPRVRCRWRFSCRCCCVRRGASALRVPGRDLVRFFLLGILGVAASNYLYYLAIQRTNVATAIILQYTAPVWVLLYTVARGSAAPSLRRIAASDWPWPDARWRSALSVRAASAWMPSESRRAAGGIFLRVL